MDTFKVCVSRVSISDHEIEVKANSYEEAYKSALEKAGDLVFEEKDTEYKVLSINDNQFSSLTEVRWQDRKDILPEISDDEKDLLESILLKNSAIRSFSVNFSGSGDDGGVADIYVDPFNFMTVLNDVVCDGDNLETLLTNVASKMIYHNNLPVDWVNDSGGSGSVTFELDSQNKLKITFTVSENVLDTGVTFTRIF